MNSADSPLQRPVQTLGGITPEQLRSLARLGIRRVHHLLFHFPRDYQVVDPSVEIAELEEGTTVAVVGEVAEVDSYQTAAGQLICGVLIRQGSHFLRATWFNQPFVRGKYHVGQRVRATGRVRFRGLRWEMAHPQVTVLAPDEESRGPQVMPVYPLTAGIKQPFLRRLIQRAVTKFAQFLDEALPLELRESRQLLSIRDAVRMLHDPVDELSRDAALRRFRYQELLTLQLAMAWQTVQRQRVVRAPELLLDTRIDARIRRLLPYALTADQDRVVSEIADDMGSSVPMHRLLQGEVGSGKTLVAAYAMLLAIAHGYQTALMAPTEILAHQHFEIFQRLLQQSRVRMALLAGSITARERRERLAELAAGQLDLVVGTHALASDEVRFQRPGLVVVDEQHKFGVQQRSELRGGELAPHYLTMSATPIPRSLARALMGDLKISTIRELPPGRQSVHTYLGAEDDRAKWWDFFRRKLNEGRQGLIVSPFIARRDDDDADDSDGGRDERKSAETLCESLAQGELEAYRIDVLHGRMQHHERLLAMEDFRSGKTQVLIATSLIEVGIDVPNAAVMTIEHADRFGLAQLHQLRGRVGRGSFPGYVCLYSTSEDAQVRQRLAKFAQTTSGFDVAELDLQLRGPGDLLGTRQHGSLPFRAADLARDIELLEHAGLDARQILAADPDLAGEQWQWIKRTLQRRYGELVESGDTTLPGKTLQSE